MLVWQQACGGTVLRCLTQKREEISSDSCRKEVYYYEKMEVQDFNNDVILAAQCQADVGKYCKFVEPGQLQLLHPADVQHVRPSHRVVAVVVCLPLLRCIADDADALTLHLKRANDNCWPGQQPPLMPS